MSQDKQFAFWNNDAIVDYFASKPADPLVRARLEQIDGAEEKNALDLGCGGGRHSELLAQLKFHVTAIDINPEMIAYTKRRVSTKDLHVMTKLMSITDLKLKKNFFDVVVSTGVLHQVTSVQAYKDLMCNVSNVMKSGGLLTMNIFTNKVWDNTYLVPNPDEPYTVVTKEGLVMTLLPKEVFYAIAEEAGFRLEEECSEDIKKENTGARAVLRAHLLKV